MFGVIKPLIRKWGFASGFKNDAYCVKYTQIKITNHSSSMF